MPEVVGALKIRTTGFRNARSVRVGTFGGSHTIEPRINTQKIFQRQTLLKIGQVWLCNTALFWRADVVHKGFGDSFQLVHPCAWRQSNLGGDDAKNSYCGYQYPQHSPLPSSAKIRDGL